MEKTVLSDERNMNGIFKQIQFKDVITIAALLGAVYTSYSANSVAITLAPLKQDLSIMDNKVEAYEGRINKIEENNVTKPEVKLIIDRLDRIENKLDRLIEVK